MRYLAKLYSLARRLPPPPTTINVKWFDGEQETHLCTVTTGNSHQSHASDGMVTPNTRRTITQSPPR